jgi:hypothetical protein
MHQPRHHDIHNSQNRQATRASGRRLAETGVWGLDRPHRGRARGNLVHHPKRLHQIDPSDVARRSIGADADAEVRNWFRGGALLCPIPLQPSVEKVSRYQRWELRAIQVSPRRRKDRPTDQTTRHAICEQVWKHFYSTIYKSS